MPRRYRRFRGYRSGRVRYSNETAYISWESSAPIGANETFPVFTTDSGTVKGFTVVPATDVFGLRKVKNFTISLSTTQITSPVVALLVYVPAGTEASNVNTASVGATGLAGSLYEPNQNVIAQFVVPPSDTNNGIVRYSTRLSRNLSSGDKIVLVFGSTYLQSEENNQAIIGTVNYAIKY